MDIYRKEALDYIDKAEMALSFVSLTENNAVAHAQVYATIALANAVLNATGPHARAILAAPTVPAASETRLYGPHSGPNCTTGSTELQQNAHNPMESNKVPPDAK